MFSEAEKQPITVRWVICLGAEQTQLGEITQSQPRCSNLAFKLKPNVANNTAKSSACIVFSLCGSTVSAGVWLGRGVRSGRLARYTLVLIKNIVHRDKL